MLRIDGNIDVSLQKSYFVFQFLLFLFRLTEFCNTRTVNAGNPYEQ